MDDPFDAMRPDQRSRGRAAELFSGALDRVHSRGDPVFISALVGLSIVAVLGVGVWWLSQGRAQPVELPRADDESAVVTGGSTPASSEAPPSEPPDSEESTLPEVAVSREAVVHVAGQVHEPGIYRLDANGRLADAINAAGGPTAQADLERVNLAEPLTDGARAYIPAVGQLEAPGTVPQGMPTPGVGPPAPPGGPQVTSPGSDAPAEPTSSDLVNLNTADQSALEGLPGVGPVTAEAIVAHRNDVGAFTQVEDLLEVRGIGEAKLESLVDLVTV